MINTSTIGYIAQKFKQHERRLRFVLSTTQNKPIVERSARDDFRGAIPFEEHCLSGINMLGQMWAEIRARI